MKAIQEVEWRATPINQKCDDIKKKTADIKQHFLVTFLTP